jgi:hypothetical protein
MSSPANSTAVTSRMVLCDRKVYKIEKKEKSKEINE